MRPVLRTIATLAAVVVAVAGGFAGGWFVHVPSAAASGPATLWIVGAGSLSAAPLLPALATLFANDTPGVVAPISAQLYEGSTAAATALAGGGQPYDIFVSADFRVIPQHLESPHSTVADWEVVFAADPLVLAYSTSVSALTGIDTANWYTKITGVGVTLGAPNASTDPLGANTIIALELEDALESQGGGLYGHFFNGGEGALATATSAVKVVAETNAATALSTGEVSAYFVYRSYAISEGLTFVSLSSSVDLGGTSASNVTQYGTQSTKVLSGTGTKVVTGAPILFALTVPTTAPSTLLGTDFAAFLLSNATASKWAGEGFLPLAPEWTDIPSALPAGLSGAPPAGVAPLPAYLAALLA